MYKQISSPSSICTNALIDVTSYFLCYNLSDGVINTDIICNVIFIKQIKANVKQFYMKRTHAMKVLNPCISIEMEQKGIYICILEVNLGKKWGRSLQFMSAANV